MAKQEKTIETYNGKRISAKQFKLYLAYAPNAASRKAIKSLYLGEPVKVYAKNKDEAASTLELDV